MLVLRGSLVIMESFAAFCAKYGLPNARFVEIGRVGLYEAS